MIRQFLKEINGINFIDIGSSGSLDAKWKRLEPYINLTGFDPNAAECERMTALPHQFRRLQYLPYAISGDAGRYTLYKTNSIYCYSLLRPNMEWLRRFSYSDLFESAGEEQVDTLRLSDVDTLKDKDIDIIKLDAQGMELPIISNTGSILDKSFFVETETGFLENYIGETTYAQMDTFMRSKGFLLFDINSNHRITRNNLFKEVSTDHAQILWCEATWLKDYVSLIKNGNLEPGDISREKAMKVLIIYALQGCLDFGFELAQLFNQLNLIDHNELKALENKNNWLFEAAPKPTKKLNVMNKVFRLLPASVRKEISVQADLASKQKHLFR